MAATSLLFFTSISFSFTRLIYDVVLRIKWVGQTNPCALISSAYFSPSFYFMCISFSITRLIYDVVLRIKWVGQTNPCAHISCAYFSPSSTRDLPTRYSKNYQTRVSCKFKRIHTHHPNWRLGARPVAHFWMLSIIRLRQHVISPHDIVKTIRPECHANLNAHTHTTQTGVWVPDQWLTSGCFL